MNRSKIGVARNTEFPGAVPEIPVRDINEAAAYYENNLGFTVDWGGGELGLAGVSKGNCRMFLANSDYRKECGNVGPCSRVGADHLLHPCSPNSAKSEPIQSECQLPGVAILYINGCPVNRGELLAVAGAFGGSLNGQNANGS